MKRDYVYLDNDVDFANVEREFATRRLLARMTPEELGQMVQEEDEGEDDEDDAGRRGIPMDLLRLWDEEDGREDEDDVNKNRLFNDELWGHQWYMVREGEKEHNYFQIRFFLVKVGLPNSVFPQEYLLDQGSFFIMAPIVKGSKLPGLGRVLSGRR